MGTDMINTAASSRFSVCRPPKGAGVVLSSEDDSLLREALKRCSPATYEAARRFRLTGNTEHLPAIVQGVVERYVEPDLRPKFSRPAEELRLSEDLGIDSLTMIEIVMLAEDVLRIPIDHEEASQLRTLADVRLFLECKLCGQPWPSAQNY